MFGKRKNPLDRPFLTWPTGDKYTIADMLRSMAIFGATGTGKSSASALGLVRSILGTNAGGLVLCSKPEDRNWWMDRLKEAGRIDDAILFAEDSPHRCNYMDFESRHGAGPRVYALPDDHRRGAGRPGRQATGSVLAGINERIIYQAIVPVLAAYGKADAPSIQRFINTAAYKPALLVDEEWQAGYHNQTLEIANARVKDPLLRYDLIQANDFWPGEFAGMDDRPRSSGLLGVNNCLHVFNSGLVRELCSTTTTFTPESIEFGKWVIVDFPVPKYGVSGKFIMAGLKYLTQRHILRRTFTPGDPPIVIYADEAQTVVNSEDADFVLQARSHGGCLLYLTQSIANYQERMGKENADMLIGQMAHKIFHVVDPATARYASELAGSAMQETYGGNQQAPGDLMDQMLGVGQWNGNVNQGVLPLIEPRKFMIGRTGGHSYGLMVDSWVIRLGMPFRGGSSAIRCSWSQR